MSSIRVGESPVPRPGSEHYARRLMHARAPLRERVSSLIDGHEAPADENGVELSWDSGTGGDVGRILARADEDEIVFLVLIEPNSNDLDKLSRYLVDRSWRLFDCDLTLTMQRKQTLQAGLRP